MLTQLTRRFKPGTFCEAISVECAHRGTTRNELMHLYGPIECSVANVISKLVSQLTFQSTTASKLLE